MLNKTENFNISEGNVKENNIFYKECCDKFIDYVKKSHNEQNLTEQWKKGELPFGRYYIKDINDEIFADSYTNNGFINGFEDFFDSEISEVLAPIPSYEEWIELGNKYDSLQEQIYAQAPIHLENQQFKELLKECREGLEKIKHIGETKKLGAVYQVAERTLTKIDEALK